MKLPGALSQAVIDGALHLEMAIFVKIFPHTMIDIVLECSPHFRVAILVKIFPEATGLVVFIMPAYAEGAIRKVSGVRAIKYRRVSCSLGTVFSLS